MKDKIKKLLDNCTSGLKGDPELQLDIQAEFHNHILERMEEEEANGADEEKSLETALKAFGEAPEIADGIVSANKKRMNLRAKLRLAAMYLIIPLSVIAAFICLDFEGLVATLDQVSVISAMGGGEGGMGLPRPLSLRNMAQNIVDFKKALSFGLGEKELTEEEKLILYGDPKGGNSGKYKVLAEKYPDNKIYMDNYITEIAGSVYPVTDEEYVRELRKAEKLDPDNARYNYLLADHFCEEGCEIDYSYDEGKVTFKLKDRNMLDKGMAELKKAMGKPYLRAYSDDLLRKQLEILGQPETLAEHIQQVAMAAGVLLPGVSKYRELARISPYYAEILINENKKDEALPYLEVWKKLGIQSNDDSWTLIEILVSAAIFEVHKDKIPEVYKKAGHPELAEKYVREQEILSKPVKEWKARMKLPEVKESQKDLEKSAGILTAMLIPAIGEKVDKAELEANRTLDYIILEKYVLSNINLLILFFMICCLVVIIRGKFPKSETSSILMMPDLANIGKIFLYCVILPVIVYYVASRLPFIGGRDYNLKFNVIKWSIQLMALLIAVIVIPVEATSMYVRKRFKAFDLPVPKRVFAMRGNIFRMIFGILLVLALCPAFIFHTANDLVMIPVFYVGFVCFLICLNLVIRFARGIFCKKQYRCYFSSVAKTLIPVFGGTVVLLVAITKPYISTQETYLVQNDPLMKMDMENLSFTSIEGRVTKRLRNEIKKAEESIKPKKEINK